jgi:pimeloyl-ACP methyl ester carboxylesterase
MDRVGEIKVPTLIVVGTEDKLTPVKFSRYLHKKIAGSELLEVEGAGHLVMAERPDIVNPAIQRFLR